MAIRLPTQFAVGDLKLINQIVDQNWSVFLSNYAIRFATESIQILVVVVVAKAANKSLAYWLACGIIHSRLISPGDPSTTDGQVVEPALLD